MVLEEHSVSGNDNRRLIVEQNANVPVGKHVSDSVLAREVVLVDDPVRRALDLDVIRRLHQRRMVHRCVQIRRVLVQQRRAGTFLEATPHHCH